MIKEVVYICHNDDDIIEAVKLSELNPKTYAHKRARYPWYMGWREDDGELRAVSTDNSNGVFSYTDWLKNAIELPTIDLYEKLGMKT